MSQISRGCNKQKLQRQVGSATSLLEKGKRFNSMNLAVLVKNFMGMTKSISTGCKLSDLEAGKWNALKEALQALAPDELVTGEVDLGKNDNELVANTISLAMFGKPWKDQYPGEEVPALGVGAESTTEAEAEDDTVQFNNSLTPWYERGVALLESGSNTSQLVASKWNPLSFVGGIIIGIIALAVVIICVLLNIVNVIVMSVLNGIFGSIYCLIKKAVQMKDPDPQGFIPCMKTNLIAHVFKIAWRCNTACGMWGLSWTKAMFEAAFDVESDRGGLVDETAPECIQ